MKKNIFKKIVATGMLCLTLGGPVMTFATSQSTNEFVRTSNEILEQLGIQNGDFNEGLDHWIVSSPGTQNPAIEEMNGNKFVIAKYGENIHQYLALKPNTTYTFSYDVAGSTDFPAKVEFGTMNHGEGFIALEEVEHNNENWARREFTFTTPENENTYILRFSSTGNGWAKFDNIQVEPEKTETSLLTVGVESRQAFAYLNLDAERFNSSERLMVYVDGSYHFETYEGVAYYSFVNKNDENIQARRGFAGKKGQTIEVYTAPRKPGQSSEGKQLLESITLAEDLAVDSSLLDDAVKNVKLSGSRLSVEFDRESFEMDNRMIIRKNGEYSAEVYKGKQYYSTIRKRTDDIITITKDAEYQKGDIISVELSSGTPGSTSNSLQVLATFEVK
ncbi:carbohydrate binding domain-containing protein [Enterococcus mundtii]|uniref:CBM-cenC domain-containing protein n=1 Tax=Enterococcus mundtii TaxID=53346 RepID=A0A242KHB3_ENTMU|nr:carbohydrate binding domain-containing protein [Enterococcus mundtii]OTP19940.1 hypothetical protein A5802_003344 [Enterococcus mundtii]